MKYSYFPGCSLKGLGRAYEESLLPVMQHLGVELDELDDWNCCGATAYMSVDEEQGLRAGRPQPRPRRKDRPARSDGAVQRLLPGAQQDQAQHRRLPGDQREPSTARSDRQAQLQRQHCRCAIRWTCCSTTSAWTPSSKRSSGRSRD